VTGGGPREVPVVRENLPLAVPLPSAQAVLLLVLVLVTTSSIASGSAVLASAARDLSLRAS
jgi:hypothetical protein